MRLASTRKFTSAQVAGHNRKRICDRFAGRLAQSLGEHRHDESGFGFLFADLFESEAGMKPQ